MLFLDVILSVFHRQEWPPCILSLTMTLLRAKCTPNVLVIYVISSRGFVSSILTVTVLSIGDNEGSLPMQTITVMSNTFVFEFDNFTLQGAVK